MRTFTIHITGDTRLSHKAFTCLVNRILGFFKVNGQFSVDSCEINSHQSRS